MYKNSVNDFYIRYRKMELIISKKVKELDDLVNYFIEEAKIISTLDKECRIENTIQEKLSELTSWIKETREKEKPISFESGEIQVTTTIKAPEKDNVPSFMRPTFSFLASTSFTPHIYHESRSISSERSRLNDVIRLERNRSESIERNRNRSESIERNRPRCESAEPSRNRSESTERNRTRSESIERIKNRSESIRRMRESQDTTPPSTYPQLPLDTNV